MNEFLLNYPSINIELDKVKSQIKQALGHPDDYIQTPILDMLDSGGKMLRPVFVVLAGGFGRYDSTKIVSVATAVELLHTATLIHDDIIDNAKTRRGVETIQSRYGKDVAVYAGDYVLAKCTSLIHENYDQALAQMISKRIAQMCVGEIKQYKFRYNADISIMQYIKIVSAKTAGLFAASLYAGAYQCGLRGNTLNAFARTGLRIGIAFQIIDDCLDYTGSEGSIQKTSQNDLKQGFYTLPLICALKNDISGELKKLLDQTVFSEKDCQQVHACVIANQGVETAKSYARKYTDKAFDALKTLPACDSRDVLEVLMERMLERAY